MSEDNAISFFVPLPPSVNALYSTNWRTHKRFDSKRYERWKINAFSCLLVAGVMRPAITYPVHVLYLMGRPDKRRRDAFNYEKGMGDLMVDYGILEDDSLIELGSIGWTADHPGQVNVIVRAFDESMLHAIRNQVNILHGG